MKGIIPVIALFMLTGCSRNLQVYHGDKKYAPATLQQDFDLMCTILEKKHPALHWYTDSLLYYRIKDSLRQQIQDSMTEPLFTWRILTPLTAAIRCGHTSISSSKAWRRFVQNRRIPSFPLMVRIWRDTMVVTGTLSGRDSCVQRGNRITAINGMPVSRLLADMYRYLPTDGLNTTANELRLSNNFPYFHRAIYGVYQQYRVVVNDSLNHPRSCMLPMWVPPPPDTSKASARVAPRTSRRKRLQQYRNSMRRLEIDRSTATLTLNTFSGRQKLHLQRFLRRSFRSLHRNHIQHLIIDLRNNGGGDISRYVQLTRYIRKSRFRVADSAYAVAPSLKPFGRYFSDRFLYASGMRLLSRKQKDGYYHMGWYERHWYTPRKKHHFNGAVYVLTAGATFSASALFCHAVKGQDNVTLIGEETGGGWHGNSGILIPSFTLPHTGIRVRMPLYRLVQFNAPGHTGSGVLPDVEVLPTAEGIRKRTDTKLEAAKQRIAGAAGVQATGYSN